VLLALRDAVLASGGGIVRLSALAAQLDADPEVVRSVLTHAMARGWFPDVHLLEQPERCGAAGCQPTASSAACRHCPMAGPAAG
jgi:hypothetical protein